MEVVLASQEMLITNEAILAVNSETLRHEEWIEWDRESLAIMQTELNAASSLKAAGLVVPIRSIGTTLTSYQKRNQFTPASVSMDGRPRAENDRTVYTDVSVPLPMFRKDFFLSERNLQASRKGYEPLDLVCISDATRVVAEAIEDMIVNGVTISQAATPIYGMTTLPERNLFQLRAAWSLASSSARDIVQDVLDMCQKLRDDNYRGPYTLYVCNKYWMALMADNSTLKGDKTFYERILAIPEIKSIQNLSSLADDSVILIQLTRNVIDLPTAMEITAISQPQIDNLEHRFTVQACVTSRVKSDMDGHCGICHGNLTGS